MATSRILIRIVYHKTIMRYITFIILTAIIWSCEQKGNSSHTENFIVNTYSIPLDTNVRNTLYHKEHYFCLTGNRQFICLENTFKVDSSITKSIGQKHFDYTYLSSDSLIAVVYVKDTVTENYYLNSDLNWERLTKNQKREPFFEDDIFTVSSCCAGEFGGAIFFTDKKSNRVYSCPATCATIINKFKDSYYVTSTLAHLNGSTKIIRIDDPLKLYELTEDSLKNYCNWWTRLTPKESKSSYESYQTALSKFEIGTQTILDTTDVLTMTSFVFNNQFYHIQSTRNKTFISKLQGDTLLYVDSIFNKQLWSFEPKNRKYSNMQMLSWNNREASGFLTINSDTISIVTFD